MKTFILAGALATWGCSPGAEPESTAPIPDVGLSDISSSHDVAMQADTATAPADTGSTLDLGSQSCDVTIEAQSGITLAVTQTEPVAAGSNPVVCWTLEAGATAPGPEGWHLRVEREENAGSEMVEWVATSVATELRQLRYGDCDSVSACGEPRALTPGSHFFHVWDEGDPSNVGGSTVVMVE